MTKLTNPFRNLTKFEWTLWLVSCSVVAASYLLSPDGSLLSLCASLLGVTALIFVAKGHVAGQLLCIIFAVLYGIISFYFRYYGEMITYLCMSAPAAVAAVISWLKNPYGKTDEVKVGKMNAAKWAGAVGLSVAVTVAFYFILKALDTANLLFSTLSVATSFLASSLTFLRSPYYALAYAANDVVLIVLWVLAAIADPAYLPMIFCFIMFLANDLYGFFNWRRMKRRQEKARIP
ncbi:MAG: nicotinamide mononucleotide transporter [Ruminococcaceae bacterium]|nr:nicotinamide mononucleotide transporter [Oscillospiraceae bacterium]